MRLRLTIDITENELKDMVRYAVLNGFMREEPKSRWSVREEKEAARFAVHAIVNRLFVKDASSVVLT